MVCEVREAGDEIVIHLSGDPVYRTSVTSPNYSDQFDATISELATRSASRGNHDNVSVVIVPNRSPSDTAASLTSSVMTIVKPHWNGQQMAARISLRTTRNFATSGIIWRPFKVDPARSSILISKMVLPSVNSSPPE